MAYSKGCDEKAWLHTVTGCRYVYTALKCSMNHITQHTLKRTKWHSDIYRIPEKFVFFFLLTWWRHQMETFSALLAICAGNSSVTGEFPAQRPVTRSFDIVFHMRLNERLSKQSWDWCFETPSRSICTTASRQINALKRLTKFLNERSRILVYKSFISSNFNYCPVTWMFCGRRNVIKLEKLQERALRFVFMDSDSSYTDLLKRGNFLSLSAYKIRNLAMEMFKCFHGMNPMHLNNLFCKQEIKYNLRDKTVLEQPRFSTKTYG